MRGGIQNFPTNSASSSNSFSTIQPDSGTSPVATSPTDTLTLTSSDGSITITGDALTDTVDFKVASSGGAPANATYVVMSLNGTLSDERVLTAGTAISVTDGGAGGNVTIANTGVTSNVAGTGINVSGATGAVTITNTGVTSLTATANQTTVSGATGAVTIGTVQNIGTGSTPTFAGLTLSGLTQGSVVFAGSGGVLSQDNTNFFWDNTSKALALGQNTVTLNVNSVAVTAQLTVDMSSDLVGVLNHTHNSTASIASNFILAKSRGTHGTPTIVASGDTIGIVAGYGYTGNSTVGYQKLAQIRFNVATGTVSTTSMPGQMEFYITPDLSVTPARAMLVDQNKAITMDAYGTGIAHFSAAGLISSSLIVNADVSASAAIAYSKLNLTGSIVNADVSTTAAIAITKIANGTANQLIKANAGATANEFATLSGGTGLSVTFGVGTISLANTGVTSIVAGTAISISGATGAVTVNNIGVTSAIGTANQVNVSAATGAVTFSLPQSIHTGASPTFTGLTLSGLTSTGVLYNVSGLIKTESVFTYDETNNILFVPEVAGGSTSSDSLMVSANSVAFLNTNTGRIQLMERMTWNNSWTAADEGSSTMNGTVWTISGTITTALSNNIFPTVSSALVMRYSASQLISSFPTFQAATIFRPTAATTDSSSFTQFSGFVSKVRYSPDIASGTATTDMLAGYAAAPQVSKANAGTVVVTNVVGFATYNVPGIFVNDIENCTITNLYHFRAANPLSGSVTLTNNIGVYIPALNLGTNRYGYYSDLTASANYWDIYSAGGAQSSHEGLFKFGDNVAPTALVHTTGSTTARASMRIETGTAPTSPNSGDIWHDSTQKTIQQFTAGVTQNIETSLFVATANKNINTSAAETTIIGTGVGTLTLPANFFVAGKTIHLKIFGFYGTKGSPVGSTSIKLKLGSTVIVTNTFTLTASLSNDAWMYEAIITCRTTGGSGTVFGQAIGTFDQGSSTEFTSFPGTTATVTVDTTASQVLDVTWTWATSNVNNTVTSTNVFVEVKS